MRVAALLAIAMLTAMLTACATANTKSVIAGLEVSLTSAETAATLYARLPVCGAAAICQNPAVTAKLKAADATAYAAVKSAEAAAASGASVDTTAAVAAVAALQSAIPALGGK